MEAMQNIHINAITPSSKLYISSALRRCHVDLFARPKFKIWHAYKHAHMSQLSSSIGMIVHTKSQTQFMTPGIEQIRVIGDQYHDKYDSKWIRWIKFGRIDDSSDEFDSSRGRVRILIKRFDHNRIFIFHRKHVGKWVPFCCTLGGGVDLGLGFKLANGIKMPNDILNYLVIGTRQSRFTKLMIFVDNEINEKRHVEL
ncbi:hypothetical protein AGLY_006801 [Aphis glycines]|uniref:Uncharacterized protein n=1 Tax=Aphis glycines TaxID=307491 RepID=A0A6G0TRJ4_APHGL|nr:hypothetical protein AGLY_006801 [Aphis glycines]